MSQLINSVKAVSSVLLVVLMICLVISCVTGGRNHEVLVVMKETSDQPVFSFPVNQIGALAYTYTQSYDRGTVVEYFRLADQELLPVRMTYTTDSYDYHGSRYPDSTLEVQDDMYEVMIHSAPGYPSISYRVGYTIEQILVVESATDLYRIRFQDIGAPGELITVQVQ